MSLEGQYPVGTFHMVTGPGVVMLQLIVSMVFGHLCADTEMKSGVTDALKAHHHPFKTFVDTESMTFLYMHMVLHSILMWLKTLTTTSCSCY